jgi:hypothetical protein
MKKPALFLFAALGFVQAASAAAPPFSVTNPNDGGAGSLRQAIINANNAAGADTIIFDSTFFSTTRTISLTTGELAITGSVTIQGPGANLLTVRHRWITVGNCHFTSRNRRFTVADRRLTIRGSGPTVANKGDTGFNSCPLFPIVVSRLPTVAARGARRASPRHFIFQTQPQ